MVTFTPSANGLNQIREYINDIELSLSIDAVYSALALALALPDICASMHLRNAEDATTRTKYVRWCRQYVTTYARGRGARAFRTSHIYALRCAFLHNGTTRLLQRHNRARGVLGACKLVWEGAEPHPNIIVAISTPGFIRRRDLFVQINVGLLCRSITAGVRRWLVVARTNHVVQRNIRNIIGVEFRGPGWDRHLRERGQPLA
jgi:hypothetical protein